ncbi:MAG: T9SS type A sorting domain-containing protein [Ignavibacteriae bacterium]|nr:T9SS type A sorting domain-containing protein [Ignavibacteriota bacterium]
MKALRLSLAVFIVISTVLIANSIFSQSNTGYDNPNVDRIPYNLLKQSQINSNYSPTSVTSSVVTTADGYDNFFLGVDFAEPHIALNPNNPLQYFTAFNTNATHYTMNGLDWFTNNPTFPGFTMMGDPVTAYDSLGNLYYDNMYGDGASAIYGTKIAVSSNNGLTWSYVSGNTGADKNWIAADQTGGPYANYVYGTMTNGSSCNVMRSTNRGVSFQTVASLTPHGLPGAMPCVGPNMTNGNSGGCVYVVTNSGSSFAATYSFFVSTNGGASFTLKSQQNFTGYVGTNVGGRNSVENMRTRPYPFITADNSFGPYRGRLYLVYSNNQPAGDGNKPDIFCRYSTDQGATFSSPVQINDDVNPTTHNQWHPSVWCDKQTGRLFVKWLDTRNCPTNDSCDVYASFTTNGGASFTANQRVTNKNFKIDCISCGGGGTPKYLGDYDAITSYGKTSMIVWSDYRQSSFGSYTSYFPDYAMKLNPTKAYAGNNDSAFVRVVVPSIKNYSDYVKFTATVDTLPAAGTIQLSFVNGKDSLTVFPDSVTLRVKTIGSVTPGVYGIIITGKGPNGIPVHQRIQNFDINVATLSIGTNRDGVCDFKINTVQYNTRQISTFNLGSSLTLQALSPKVVGGTRYIYQNWSQGGDTTQTFTVNNAATYTANYKAQFRLLLNSSIGNSFGGGLFYDSAVTFQFGVNSRFFTTGGLTYQFKGWTGVGTGSYTSPDSSGLDTIRNIAIGNAIVETARWVQIQVGVQNIGTEIPNEFKLYQNYPNPFNPVTNINFDIAKAGMVQIKVYDVLGKEVEILANEVLQPGRYKTSFDANRLSSGIYFYRITTNDFTDIKRMMVIK